MYVVQDEAAEAAREACTRLLKSTRTHAEVAQGVYDAVMALDEQFPEPQGPYSNWD